MFRKSRQRKELAKQREHQERLAARPTVQCRPDFQHDTDAAIVQHDWHNPNSYSKVETTERGADFHINTAFDYCARCGLRETREIYKGW